MLADTEDNKLFCRAKLAGINKEVVMSINGIVSGGGFDISKVASDIATKVIKKVDTNGDGSIDKKEFVAGMTAKGMSADEAGKRFDSIDSKHTGKITKADIESAIKTSFSAGGPPSGGRPAGAHARGGTRQTAASLTAGGSKTYDKKDTNKDGTVSAAEELAYGLAHPAATEDTGKAAPQDIGSNVNVTA